MMSKVGKKTALTVRMLMKQNPSAHLSPYYCPKRQTFYQMLVNRTKKKERRSFAMRTSTLCLVMR